MNVINFGDIFNFSFLEFLADPVFWITLLLIITGGILLYIFGKKALRRFSVLVRQASYESKSLDAVIYEVRVPKNNEVDAKAADQMFSNLLAIGSADKDGKWKDVFKANSFISFEVVAFREYIKFYVVASKNLANIVEKTINSSYNAAEVISKDEYNIFAKDGKIEFAQLKLATDNYKPIKTYEEMSTDSISAILTTMGKLNDNEAIVYQIIISSAKSDWRNKGKGYVSGIRDAMSDLSLIHI